MKKLVIANRQSGPSGPLRSSLRFLYFTSVFSYMLWIGLGEEICIHKRLRRREVSGDAVSRRRRRSHGSADPIP